MTPKQLAILNALVTYTAENVSGGLTEDEREVAKIVGAAALMGKETATRKYNYATTNVSFYKNEAAAANDWADRGWRVVAVVNDTRLGYSPSLILERSVDVSHPDD